MLNVKRSYLGIAPQLPLIFLWTCNPVRSKVEVMKTSTLLGFVFFISITALLSGCAKTDSSLESENADLKARVQQLEQQLQAAHSQSTAPAAPQSESASTQALQGQMDEAQKRADAATDQSKTLSSQVDELKQKVVELTRQLSEAQQARQNAEKALQLYQDKAGAALKQFQALRDTLGGGTAQVDSYHQHYLATESAVANLVAALPESTVRRQIVGVMAQFMHLDNVWETTDRQMQTRTREAQATYDRFVDLGGYGPVDRLVELGQERILAPVKQENAVTASNRDRQLVPAEKDLDQGISQLQTLLNGQPT
jgi:predicted  nucleic acid-binding Zn-ribbon protein